MKYQLEALAGLFKGCACDRGLIKQMYAACAIFRDLVPTAIPKILVQDEPNTLVRTLAQRVGFTAIYTYPFGN